MVVAGLTLLVRQWHHGKTYLEIDAAGASYSVSCDPTGGSVFYPAPSIPRRPGAIAAISGKQPISEQLSNADEVCEALAHDPRLLQESGACAVKGLPSAEAVIRVRGYWRGRQVNACPEHGGAQVALWYDVLHVG